MENLACFANADYILLAEEITKSGFEKAVDLLNNYSVLFILPVTSWE